MTQTKHKPQHEHGSIYAAWGEEQYHSCVARRLPSKRNLAYAPAARGGEGEKAGVWLQHGDTKPSTARLGQGSCLLSAFLIIHRCYSRERG